MNLSTVPSEFICTKPGGYMGMMENPFYREVDNECDKWNGIARNDVLNLQQDLFIRVAMDLKFRMLRVIEVAIGIR